MKKLLMIIVCVIFTHTTYSQESVKEIIKFNDGTQKGTLVWNGTKYVQDGNWKSKFAKAKYDMGKLVWYEPKGLKRYTYEQIQLKRLEKRLDKLQKSLALNDKTIR